MRSLLLYGFYGIKNAGNEAMLQAFIEPIREYFRDDVEFVVANRHPDQHYDEQYRVRSIPNLEYQTREASKGRWLRGFNPDDSPEFLAFMTEVSKADLVVIGPGQYLVETGEYGMLKGALAQLTAVVTACYLTRTPCYGLALACEPLSSPWSKLIIDGMLPYFSRLTFRDQQSIVNLNDAGIHLPDHDVLGDLALAGEAAEHNLGKEVLKAENIPMRSDPRLALALRNLYWLQLDQKEFRKRLSTVLTHWLKHSERDVLMIPQNIYCIDTDRDDDRTAADELIRTLPQKLQERIHVVRGEYAPAQIESLYSGCDVTLSARLHGAVFSCKQGTPPVMLTFMDKARGFFRRIKHSECMIDLMASADEISEKLEDFLDRRKELSLTILSEVEEIRLTARQYSQIAIKLLQQDPVTQKKWTQQILERA